MDLRAPGGGQHQRPSVPSALKHNLTSVRLEAHVQHAVRLIQHPERHALQVGPDVLTEIQQPAWSGDHRPRSPRHFVSA